MTRLAVIGLALFATVAFAQPPSETVPNPVPLNLPTQTSPPTAPVVLLEGTTVPACPTTFEATCPNTTRPGLLTRISAQPKAVFCE
jgi:hypothetical protein